MRKRIVTTSAVVAGLLLIGGGTAIAITNGQEFPAVSEKSDKSVSETVVEHAVSETKSTSTPAPVEVTAPSVEAVAPAPASVDTAASTAQSVPVNNGTPGVSNPHNFDFSTPGQANPFVDYNPETAGNPIGGFTDNGGTVSWSENGDIAY